MLIYYIYLKYSILYAFKLVHIYPPSLKVATLAMFMFWLQSCKMLLYLRTTLLFFFEYLSDVLENWRKVRATVALLSDFATLYSYWILIYYALEFTAVTGTAMSTLFIALTNTTTKTTKTKQTRFYNHNSTSVRGEIICEPLWCLRFTSLLSAVHQKVFCRKKVLSSASFRTPSTRSDVPFDNEIER